MKLCWNAIVRNEAARIERAMQSLIHQVDYAVILDTGSTDDTIGIIKTFFAANNKPVEVVSTEFINFEQARNEALDLARASWFDWEYLLLMDADMEMVMLHEPDLTLPAYQAMQKAGTELEYFNPRFLSRNSKGSYIGVTHEFLNVPEGCFAVPPGDVFFIDHADGANRADKFVRDIRLLKAGLEKEPTNPRYHFYLAQSYRDAGMPREAVDWYKKRVALGGWDEEVWDAQLNVATCMRGYDEAGFVFEALKAHELRPRRAEALYELAQFFVNKGNNKLATMFSREAMSIPKPDDVLFVNPRVYAVAAREVFSIAAFYDEKTRPEGFSVCDGLALGQHGYRPSTDQARSNLFHYLPRAHAIMPSFWSMELKPRGLPEGWALLNPSIARFHDELQAIVRTVNYTITPEGRYDIDGKGSDISADNPICTRNFLVKLDNGLQIMGTPREIIAPPAMDFPLVLGWEDMRLIPTPSGLATSATVRDANAEGRCEQWFGHLVSDGHQLKVMQQKRLPSYQHFEKNWMPIIAGKTASWVHSIGTVVHENGSTQPTNGIKFNAEHLRGGSQAIKFRSGFLAVVHEAIYDPQGQRAYFHRFVFFDVDLNVRNVSKPFVFHDKQIEFCAGMCMHPDGKHLLISYGVKDKAAWIGRVDNNEVAEFVFA